jgi:outer membrane protein OmpA-like peptidoglycan-associated protein
MNSHKSLTPQEDHWIPLSDLMTGLMMFFMLLALCFMMKVQADSKRVKQIAVLYDKLRIDLYVDLENEFHNDLPKWGAEIDKDLTVRFREPDVLFDTGKDDLKPRFKTILDDFFPRYIAIITSKKYRDSIQEVRIEGHTSSVWSYNTSKDDAYFKNMELSQSRTRTTLQYVLNLPQVQEEKEWLFKHLTANGLSSSKLILNEDGTENMARSQRVEFRVRTDAEARIEDILETVEK